MSFILLSDEQLKALNIDGQQDDDLSLDYGLFFKDGWTFLRIEIETEIDNTIFRRIYVNNTFPSTELYIISTLESNINSKYQFYELSDLIIDYGDFELLIATDGTRELLNLVTIPSLSGLSKTGRAIEFNGIDMGVTNINIAINSSVCTICFHLFDTLDTDGILFKFTESDSLIKIFGTNLIFTDSSGDTILATSITQGAFCLIFDGTNITTYLNGVEGDTVTPTTTALTIWSDISPNDNRTSSTINNILILKDGMTSAEVLSQFSKPENFVFNLVITRIITWFPMVENGNNIYDWKNFIETGAYDIDNPTSSMRMTGLDTGIQVGKYELNDVDNRLIGEKDYLNLYGTEYIDTNWDPYDGSDYTLEIVLEIERDISSTMQFGGDLSHYLEQQSNNNLLYYGQGNRAFSATYSAGLIHIVVEYVSATGVVSLTINGSTIGTEITTTTGVNTTNFLIGKKALLSWQNQIKLFKVHTTTQVALDLYNEAISKGLL